MNVRGRAARLYVSEEEALFSRKPKWPSHPCSQHHDMKGSNLNRITGYLDRLFVLFVTVPRQMPV
jgi:hypothetical protein